MEFMAGGTLAQYIVEHHPLSDQKIALLVKDILNSLEYLHGNKIIHRDIKADNLLLDKN